MFDNSIQSPGKFLFEQLLVIEPKCNFKQLFDYFLIIFRIVWKQFFLVPDYIFYQHMLKISQKYLEWHKLRARILMRIFIEIKVKNDC